MLVYLHRATTPLKQLIILITIFLCSAANAQNEKSNVWLERPLNQNSVEYWHQSSPLGRAEIKDIAQDNIGYIWMASNEGVLKFNGREVNTYDLSNTPVFNSESFSQVEMGADGVMWISTRNNLFYYKDSQFHLWQDQTRKLKEEIVQLEFDNKDVLWVLSGGWLSTIDSNSSIEDPLSFGPVKSMTKGGGNSLWIVDEQGRVFQLKDHQKVARVDIEQLFKGDIERVIDNGFGVIYVSNFKGELFKLTASGKQLVAWNDSPNPIRIDGLVADSNGFIWIEAEKNLNRVNDIKVESLNNYYGLSDYRVRKVFEDRDGDFWIGTYSGLSFLHQSAVGFMEVVEGSNVANTRAIIEDPNGNVWIGTQKNGLLRLEGHELKIANTSAEFPKSVYSLALTSKNQLLVGGDEGLFLANISASQVNIQKKIFNQSVRSIHVSDNGKIWVNCRVPDGSYKSYEIEDGNAVEIDELHEKKVNFWYESGDGLIWIGTNSGLFKYQESEFVQVGQSQGYSKEEFNDYWVDNFGLWVNSRTNGLLNITQDSLVLHNSRSGFSIKNISSVNMDKDNGVWIWANYGMYYITQDEFKRQYISKDSLRNVEFYPISAPANNDGYPRSLNASTGEIFISSDWGLIEVHALYKPKRKAILNIESYSVEEVLAPVTEKVLNLSGRESNIVINYSAIDFLNYDNIEFEFMLEGFDTDWHNVGKRTSAVYTNLPAGTYTFRLRLRNRHESGNSEVSIILVKEPVWYKTLWFRAFLGLILLLFIYLLVRLRTAQIKANNKVLKSEVDLRTQELNEVLSSLEKTVEERTERLTTSNDQLNLAMEVGKHGAYFIDYDDEGNEETSEFTDNFFDLLGYAPNELDTSRKVRLSLIHQEDRAIVDQVSDKLIKSQGGKGQKDFYRMEYRLKRKSGEYIWIESIGKIYMRHQNGRVRKYVGMLTDISDRKKAELELLAKEERFRKVFDSSTNAMLLINEDCEIAMKNQAAEQLYGYQDTEWSKISLKDLLPKEFEHCHENFARFNESVLAFERGEGDVHIEVHTKSGRPVPVQIGFSKVSTGGQRYILAVITDLTELVRIKTELEKSEQRFKEERDKYESIFHNTTDALFIIRVMDDGTFQYVEFNKVAETNLKRTTEEVAGKTPDELFPQQAEFLNKTYAVCRDTKETQIDREEIDFDGIPIIYDVRKVPIIENGKVTQIYGIARDISDQVKLELEIQKYQTQLNEEKEKYENAFHNINDALFLIEVDGDKFKFLEFNKVEEEITGLKNDQVSGKYTHEIFPEFADYFDRRYASCRDKGEIITYQERLNFRGIDMDFETSLVPLKENGKVVRIIGIAHDITELIKSQKAIKEREEKLRFALDASQDGIIDWDIKTGAVDVSPALYRMLGYRVNSTNEHILGIIKLINPTDFDVKTVKDLEAQIRFLGERQFSKEFRMKRFKGGWLWVLMRGKVVKSETGDVVRFIGTISDISAEKQKTKDRLEAILQTEDNERSRISKEIHDGLQQTLTISALNLEFLKRELGSLSERGRKKFEQGWEYLQKSIEESRNVAHTLMPKAIVDFGLVSACKSLIMEYNNTVERTTFNFVDNLGESRIPDKKIEVTLYRILQESLTNIVKYARASEVNVQLKDYSDILMLTIEDDGVGFDIQKLKESGRGFGVKSMQNRIAAVSGILEIESAPGRGTMVMVQISKDLITE